MLALHSDEPDCERLHRPIALSNLVEKGWGREPGGGPKVCGMVLGACIPRHAAILGDRPMPHNRDCPQDAIPNLLMGRPAAVFLPACSRTKPAPRGAIRRAPSERRPA